MDGVNYTSESYSGVEILFRRFTGPLTIEKENEMLAYAVEKGLINENVRGMVLDMRSAKFDFSPEDAKKILDFVESDPKLAKLKYALLLETPEQVVYPLIGATYKESALIKPFSTEAAAINWIVAE